MEKTSNNPFYNPFGGLELELPTITQGTSVQDTFLPAVTLGPSNLPGSWGRIREFSRSYRRALSRTTGVTIRPDCTRKLLFFPTHAENRTNGIERSGIAPLPLPTPFYTASVIQKVEERHGEMWALRFYAE